VLWLEKYAQNGLFTGLVTHMESNTCRAAFQKVLNWSSKGR